MSSRGTNALSVVSLVAGIASYLGLLCIGAVVAIVCGHLARSQIKKTREDGDSFALVGLVLGYSHLILGALAVMVWILFFGGLIALANSGIMRY